jgi:hypothetical protein
MLPRILADMELLYQGVVELASALVSGIVLMPVGSDFKCVPGAQHSARLLLAVEPQQKVGKAKNGTGRLAATPQDRFR